MSEITIEEKVALLKEKYEVMGQDLRSYLDGLLYSNYLTYWDYVHLETLLSLQNTLTDFPDEKIFLMYHQITELYFNLCLHEYDQIGKNGAIVQDNGNFSGWNDQLDVQYLIARLKRINSYFESLTKSFEIMIQGMDPDQFLKFRMALLPASGFQSVQYRKIEICSTEFFNLVDKEKRPHINRGATIDEMYESIYWKQGATELSSGKKTLTLKQFEKRYSVELIDLAKEYRSKNLWAKFKDLSLEDQKNEEVIQQFKQLDLNVNVNWPLVHYKSAVRYLQQNPKDIAATGGTNWQKYLPPRFQKRIFYPELWSEEELDNWGKKWVEETLNSGE
ncbi:MAG: tryptophan 2,3-dioxygenase family protein [Flavobacteriales bacterium]|nr:tryptophan 2,3-dioxygenase family protein [Flavobacteriales bacterium]